MQVVGSWRCPTGDLSDPWVGGIEVLGDYVVMARFHWRREGSDTLWIIDVSDKKNPTLAATYVETTLCYRPARVVNFTVIEDSNIIAVFLLLSTTNRFSYSASSSVEGGFLGLCCSKGLS